MPRTKLLFRQCLDLRLGKNCYFTGYQPHFPKSTSKLSLGQGMIEQSAGNQKHHRPRGPRKPRARQPAPIQGYSIRGPLTSKKFSSERTHSAGSRLERGKGDLTCEPLHGNTVVKVHCCRVLLTIEKLKRALTNPSGTEVASTLCNNLLHRVLLLHIFCTRRSKL